MKKYLLTLILLATTSAQASSAMTALEKAAVSDINGILLETYNESDGRAEATQAQCKIAKKSTQEIIAFCTVTGIVQPDTKRDYQQGFICNSLGYRIPKNSSPELFQGWEECNENINGVTEF